MGERGQFKSVQVRTAGGRIMQCEYIRSLNIFLLFFLRGSMQILQTLRVKMYTNRFQELYRCCIRLQVGVMRKPQFHKTSSDGSASSKF